jgi:hypothetical protein
MSKLDYRNSSRKILHSLNIIKAIVISGNSTAYLVLLYRLVSFLTMPFDILFSFFERIFAPKAKKSPPIIFLVGSHRSGATFISQVVSRSFPFYRVGNFNSLFPRSRYFIHRLIKQKIYDSVDHGYENYYGQSPGLFEIGDAHEVWDQWYGADHDTVPEIITNDKRKDMLDYFSKLYSAVGATIISKSGRNSLNIEKLNDIFENCFFIIIDRKIDDIVLSTLKASEVFGSDQKGWGLHVDNLSNKNLNQIDSTVIQCIKIRNKIFDQLSKLESHKYIVVDYNVFCNSTNSQLEKIKRAIDTSHNENYTIKKSLNSSFSSKPYRGDMKIPDAVHKSVQKHSFMINE